MESHLERGVKVDGERNELCRCVSYPDIVEHLWVLKWDPACNYWLYMWTRQRWHGTLEIYGDQRFRKWPRRQT